MKKTTLIYFVLLNIIAIATTHDVNSLLRLLDPGYDLTAIKVVKKIEKGKAVVTIISDSQGDKFCVRQITLTGRHEFGFVREVLASYVAESIGIPVSRARIIPSKMSFPGKNFSKKIGTLQTCALGTNKYKKRLSLEQRMKEYMPFKEKGLTRAVIKSMSLHQDLPLIVALDTFISNPDRSANNLFYNPETDRFCGIDLELAFKLPCKRDLSFFACCRIVEMLEEGVKLDKKELKALCLYTQTLKELLEKNPPIRLYNILREIALVAGYDQYNEADHSIEEYQDKISRQYKSTQLLVWLLDTFITKHNK